MRLRIKKAARQRIAVYGGLIVLAAGLYLYQPMRVDWFPRHLPSSNPPVSPDVERLFSPGEKIAVVTAHPDDSEYYIGGLLLQLRNSHAEVHLIVCTDGDKGYYPWENSARNRDIRRAEENQAASVWRAKSVTFLGYPDGRLHPNPDVVDRIAIELKAIHPEYVIAFDGDYPPRISHGDHRSSGIAAVAAARSVGVRWALLFSTLAPNHTFDVSNVWDEREKLVGFHKSQFSGEKLERVVGTIAEAAIDAGEKLKGTYGEPFRCVRL